MGAIEISIIIAGAGLLVTVIVLLVRGSYRFGALEQKVEGLGEKVDAVAESVSELRREMAEMRAEIQETNRLVAALANHHHDVDGNTLFVVIPRYRT
jgi:molybdopterin converting factor small subunit